MSVERIILNEKKDIPITINEKYYLLKSVTRNGNGECIVFIQVDQGAKNRLFRFTQEGTIPCSLLLDKNVIFSFRRKGNCELVFLTTPNESGNNGNETVSYLCENISVDQYKKKN